ncbi:MAG: hypothetical protein KAI26_00615 [Nanoarchaeota archaeon]|nr:hypothetical protein [Nanoarchaeota archaeon]
MKAIFITLFGIIVVLTLIVALIDLFSVAADPIKSPGNIKSLQIETKSAQVQKVIPSKTIYDRWIERAQFTQNTKKSRSSRSSNDDIEITPVPEYNTFAAVLLLLCTTGGIAYLKKKKKQGGGNQK